MRTMILYLMPLCLGVFMAAQERADLATPVVITNSAFTIASLTLDWDHAAIVVGLKGTNGEEKSCGYTGATATALMAALNKANLTTRSLKQRIFDRLIADGCVIGTVAGSVP